MSNAKIFTRADASTNTLALLSIFLSVHICVCFVFNQEMTHFFKNSLY